MRVLPSILGAATLVAFGLAVQGSRSDKRKTSPERETAELLDSVIQPRFQVTNGKDFGMSRIAPKIQGHGHMGALHSESDKEKQALAQVGRLGCDYRLGFVHTGYQLSRFSGKPISRKLPDLEPIWESVNQYKLYDKDDLPSYKDQVLSRVGALEKGEKPEIQQGEWQVFLRPVKAERETCASCHAGVKPGQVMGAMAYLVKRTAPS